MRSKVFACAGMAAAIALGSGPPALAAQPHCGDAVTKHLKLKKNLDCSSTNGDGLRIAKDGVTVNLAGHRIIGPGDEGAGISNTSGFSGVTVKNGRLQGWSIGVYSTGGLHPRFLHLAVEGAASHDGYGIYVINSANSKIQHVSARSVGYGVYTNSSTDQLVRDLKVKDSDRNKTYGYYGSVVSGRIEGVSANGAQFGLYVNGQTPGLAITDSTANRSDYGFYIANATPFDDYRYTLRGNTANDAKSYGFYAASPVHGHGNRAKGAGVQNCHNVPC